MALKHKKKLITTATEQFNTKPAKGIAYMQECKLMMSPPNAGEIVRFMRQNPHLDKNQLGEYISNRKNLDILEAYVKSFDFQGLRIDESLRMFLEAFRYEKKTRISVAFLEVRFLKLIACQQRLNKGLRGHCLHLSSIVCLQIFIHESHFVHALIFASSEQAASLLRTLLYPNFTKTALHPPGFVLTCLLFILPQNHLDFRARLRLSV